MQTIRELSYQAINGNLDALKALWKGVSRKGGRRTIIACDFDGTLCKSKYPTIGAANTDLLKSIRLLQRLGYETVLWTCREEGDLQEAVDWLKHHHTVFAHVNENTPYVIHFFHYNSRKVSADEYWDDKSILVRFEE